MSRDPWGSSFQLWFPFPYPPPPIVLSEGPRFYHGTRKQRTVGVSTSYLHDGGGVDVEGEGGPCTSRVVQGSPDEGRRVRGALTPFLFVSPVDPGLTVRTQGRCTCVCIGVHRYTHRYTQVYAQVRTGIRVYVCVTVRVYVWTDLYVCVLVCSVCICVCPCLCVYMCCVHMCVHVYECICVQCVRMYMYMCTRIYERLRVCLVCMCVNVRTYM